MTDRIPFRALDPGGVPDGDYVVTVAAGNIVGLAAATTGGGGAGAGEALVADGTTPPEPLTTEAGDDWLYEG